MKEANNFTMMSFWSTNNYTRKNTYIYYYIYIKYLCCSYTTFSQLTLTMKLISDVDALYWFWRVITSQDEKIDMPSSQSHIQCVTYYWLSCVWPCNSCVTTSYNMSIHSLSLRQLSCTVREARVSSSLVEKSLDATPHVCERHAIMEQPNYTLSSTG